MWVYDFALCCKFRKCRKYTFLGGSAQIITILHRGVIKIYYNITWGGVFSINYKITMGGRGSLGTPNLYYVIYGRPLMENPPDTKCPTVQNNFRALRPCKTHDSECCKNFSAVQSFSLTKNDGFEGILQSGLRASFVQDVCLLTG